MFINQGIHGHARTVEEIAVSALARTVESQSQLIAELSRPADVGQLIDTIAHVGLALLQREDARRQEKVVPMGKRERLIREQIAAEEARIERVASEARAKVLADYAARLAEAQKEDAAEEERRMGAIIGTFSDLAHAVRSDAEVADRKDDRDPIPKQ